uniref:Putative secreted peptide n=1 Tax=Anopheles braziliensis TaxID=58242 RepID=A0A2M3ZS60_9DIPT
MEFFSFFFLFFELRRLWRTTASGARLEAADEILVTFWDDSLGKMSLSTHTSSMELDRDICSLLDKKMFEELMSVVTADTFASAVFSIRGMLLVAVTGVEDMAVCHGETRSTIAASPGCLTGVFSSSGSDFTAESGFSEQK